MKRRTIFSLLLALTISLFSLAGGIIKAQAVVDCTYIIEAKVFQGQVGDFSHPLENVPVRLYGSNNPDYTSSDKILFDTSYTDVNGHVFLQLDYGESLNKYDYYFIIEENLPGYVSIGATSYSGVVITPDVIQLAYPLSDKNLVKNKFWDDLTPTHFTFKGHVYQGQVGNTTTPLAGVTVSLFGSSNPYPTNQTTLLGSTTTDNTGAYSLSLDQDTYAYYFIIEQNLAGYISVGALSIGGSVVTSDQIQFASPLAGQNLCGNDFWDDLAPTSFTFKGHVYKGQIGDTTTPLSGVTVSLFGSSSPYPSSQTTLLSSTTTDTTGAYSLTLNQDTYAYYFIVEQNLTGYVSVGAQSIGGSVVTPDVIQFANPLVGQNLCGNDFWDDLAPTSFTFKGNVYQGQVGIITTPLAGVTVSLFGSSNPYPTNQTTLLGSTTTDNTGAYSLALSQDIYAYYFIVEQNLAGYISIGAQSIGGSVVTSDQIQFASPLPGKNLTGNNFWDDLTPTSFTFKGNVYQGQVGVITTPLAGVKVSLYGSGSPYPSNQMILVGSTTTDSAGAYSLSLSVDSYAYYFIVEQNLTGYASIGAQSVAGSVVTPDQIQIDSPLPGKNLTGNNFWDDVSSFPYIFTGYVYLGQYGDISQPIGGILIRLYGSSTPYPNPLATLLGSTVTELDGSFSLPLSQDTYAYYFLTEQTPLGYFSAAAITIGGTVINSDVIQFSTPLAGLNLNGNIFWDDITACLASFTGRVFQGPVGDTTTPLGGVTVSVYGSATPYPSTQTTLIGSSVTDSIGSFRIPLTADSYAYYFLIEQNLPGYASVGASAISGIIVTPDVIQYISPLPGKNLSATKFWDTPSANAVSITGTIYQGQNNVTTTPLSGIFVNLYGSNSPYPSTQTTLLTSGVTNSSGTYNLTLPPNQATYPYYFLEVPGPSGFSPTGASSTSGTVVSPNVIQFTNLAPGQNLTNNVFFTAQNSFKMWLPVMYTPINAPLPPGELPFDAKKP